MPPISGNGGSFWIQTNPADPPFESENVQIPIVTWSLDKRARLQENTRSYNTVGTRYTSITCDPSWSLELPLDYSAFIENSGIDNGFLIPLVLFQIGDFALIELDPSDNFFYQLLNTTVESVGVVLDANGDIVRYKVSGKGGDVSGPKTLSQLGFEGTQ